MLSQTKLIDHQMFGLEVLLPGPATPVALTLTVVTVVAANDWQICASPTVSPLTLISPTEEEEERSRGQGRPHTWLFFPF